MASKLFISAKEVAKELEVSDSYAYRLIRQLNSEMKRLQKKIIQTGKVNSQLNKKKLFTIILKKYCHLIVNGNRKSQESQ